MKSLRGLGYFYRLFDIALVICEAVELGALYRPEAQKGGNLAALRKGCAFCGEDGERRARGGHSDGKRRALRVFCRTATRFFLLD